MRIAFLTSVSGMLFSIILDRRVSNIINNDAGIGDLIIAVNDGNHLLSTKIDSVSGSINDLEKSISGDGDGSLLNQLTLVALKP